MNAVVGFDFENSDAGWAGLGKGFFKSNRRKKLLSRDGAAGNGIYLNSFSAPHRPQRLGLLSVVQTLADSGVIGGSACVWGASGGV